MARAHRSTLALCALRPVDALGTCARATLALWLAPAPPVDAARYHSAAPGMTGELRIVGSRAMAAPVARWVAIFRREHPRVRVSVALYGTGVGAGAIRDGVADVAPLTRSLRASERALFADPPRSVPLLSSDPRRRPVLYLARAGGGAPSALANEFARVARSREGRGSSPFLP